MKEKDEQIKILTSKVDEYVDVQREGRKMSKEITQRFIDLEEKFNDLMGVKKKERKYNRKFELESNSKKKMRNMISCFKQQEIESENREK